MKLKIFSDPSYVPAGAGHVVMLYPFWGKNPEDPRDPSSGRYDRYAESGGAFFEMASALEAADLVVLPTPWERLLQNEAGQRLADQLAHRARQSGKKVALFFWSDSTEEVNLEPALIFRTSFSRSRRKPHEFAMPAWSEDPVARYLGGKLPLRKKREKPVVGFCGFGRISWNLKNILAWGASRLGLRDQEGFAGHCLRTRGLRLLSKTAGVEKNFIIKDSFLGGAISGGQIDLEQMQKVRREFVQNLVDSDYIFCTRGNGNFSYRLYETLSCGRIPVFVDTDCVLPYDFAIPWKKYCVWVDQSELPLLGAKLVDFHHNLSPEDFEELQYNCRRLWEEWLSPLGFFANFHRHLCGPTS